MFNTLLGAGREITTLLITESRVIEFNVLSEFVIKTGRAPGSKDLVVVDVADSIDLRPQTKSNFAINAVGLPVESQLVIKVGASSTVSGYGGKGGEGGFGGVGLSTAGEKGEDGGDAIQLGCPTTAEGSGTIIRGHGGGGGGGGGTNVLDTGQGGGGGGGGTPFGDLGLGGGGTFGSGNPGTVATFTAKGIGGTGPGFGADGGDGGEDGTAPENGGTSTGSEPKGSFGPGINGEAVITNGNSWTATGVTVTGDIV